jgi:hypothetical protein
MSTISSMFSNATVTNNNNTNSLFGSSDAFSLTDYASIKNGSYKNVLKAYYDKEDNKTTKVSDEDKASAKKGYVALKSSADALKSSASSLSELLTSKEVTDADGNKTTKYNYMKEVTKEDGTKTEEVDYDKLLSAAKSFVDSYNDMLGKYDDVNNRSILRQGVFLTGNTKANTKMLAKAGITIGENNKLQIDEEKFKQADMAAIDALFKGSNSFAGQVSRYADKTSSLSQSAIVKISSLYSKSGGYLSTLNDTSIMDAYF